MSTSTFATFGCALYPFEPRCFASDLPVDTARLRGVAGALAARLRGGACFAVVADLRVAERVEATFFVDVFGDAALRAVVVLPAAGLRGALVRAAAFFAGVFFTGAFFAATVLPAGRVLAFFAAGFAAFLPAAVDDDFFVARVAAVARAPADFARCVAGAGRVARPVRLPCAMTTLTLLLGGPVL